MYCFATVGKVTLVLSALAVFGWTPVLAQESEPPLVVAASIDIPAAQIALPSVGPRDIPTEAGEAKPRRPKALIPLYATFASLQVLDVHSTTRALDRGAVEANPVMKGVVSSPAGMLALKAGATTAIV